jgi:hypothetical protein
MQLCAISVSVGRAACTSGGRATGALNVAADRYPQKRVLRLISGFAALGDFVACCNDERPLGG